MGTHTLLGVPVTGPNAAPATRYLVALTIVVAMAWIASNIVRGRIGRMWMAVRDMDIAAELMGIRLLRAKLLAFAVSSFYVGVAGALMVFLWLGAAEPEAFNIDLSFLLLFMVIIGGLGSILGALPRRGADPYSADRPARPAGAGRPQSGLGDGRPNDLHGHRGHDHILSDRRAERPRAALADWKAETAGLAVPLLRWPSARNRSKMPEGRNEMKNTPNLS